MFLIIWRFVFFFFQRILKLHLYKAVNISLVSGRKIRHYIRRKEKVRKGIGGKKPRSEARPDTSRQSPADPLPESPFSPFAPFMWGSHILPLQT